MRYNTTTMIFDQLGLTVQEVLFHAISLIVLVLALWVLLYRPIRKIIAERRQKIAEVFETNENLLKQAENTNLHYQQLLSDAKLEAAKVAAEASQKATEKARTIIEEAEKKSAAIISVAHKETVVEMTRMHNDFKERAADMVIEVASRVIEREVTVKDNKQFIQDCLDAWE
jgi:F-type H+-transporting ATPase subunit b